MPSLVLAFLTSFAAALALTPLVRAGAARYGYTARPSQDRWRREPVPVLGGVAMAGAFLLALLLLDAWHNTLPLLIGSGLMFGLGVADDVRHFRPVTKLVAQIAIAAVLMYLTPAIVITGSPVLDDLIRFFWIIGITNAFNLLDNIDGLSAGVAAIAGLSYLALLTATGVTPTAVAIACFVGVAAGFLVFNFQPASIFMGDSGSLFLGSFLATAGLIVMPDLPAQVAPVTLLPVLVLLIPIFDTSFVTLTRRLAGRSPLLGGRDHTSHRLVALGIGERQAVLALYALAALGGAIAISLQQVSLRYSVLLAGAYVMSLAALGVLLGHVHSASADGSAADTPARPAPLVSELTYQYRSYEVLLDMGLIALAYYGAFSIRFQEPEFSHFLEYFLRSFPLVIAIQTIAFAAAGKYRQVWRSFGSSETITILKGVAYGVSASVIATLYLFSFEGFSRIVYGLDAALLTFLLVGSRLVISQFDEYLRRQRGTGRKVLIYGAGRGGVLLLRELMQNAALNLQPVGFLDDAPAKRRLRVEGLPVLGTFADLGPIAERHGAAMVVISIQALAPAQLAAIHAACMAHGLHVRRMRFALDDLGPLEVRVSRHAG